MIAAAVQLTVWAVVGVLLLAYLATEPEAMPERGTKAWAMTMAAVLLWPVVLPLLGVGSALAYLIFRADQAVRRQA